MKKYKFLVRKVEEIEIDVYAKSHLQAMTNLMLNLIKSDENFFTDEQNKKKDLFIKVKKITDEKGKENLKDYKDFIKENRFLISKFEDNFLEESDEDIEENEDNFFAEYDEIVCEKCGNCIRLDKDLLS